MKKLSDRFPDLPESSLDLIGAAELEAEGILSASQADADRIMHRQSIWEWTILALASRRGHF